MNAATLLPLFGILLAVCVNPCLTSTCPGGEHFSAWLPTRACTHHIKDVVRLVCHSFPSSLLEATDTHVTGNLSSQSSKTEIHRMLFCQCCLHDCFLTELMAFCPFVDRF
uniref:Insulin-like domain-containing protein n=1 Tax=Magallana gigas TaxID=29159 RepID=A0A8W8JD76_MAGGI